MNHPQQDDPVQPGELEKLLRMIIRTANTLDHFESVQDLYLYKDGLKALNRLITREAVRLCNAVIGDMEQHGTGQNDVWEAGIDWRNQLKAQQKQRLADLVKGEGGENV